MLAQRGFGERRPVFAMISFPDAVTSVATLAMATIAVVGFFKSLPLLRAHWKLVAERDAAMRRAEIAEETAAVQRLGQA